MNNEITLCSIGEHTKGLGGKMELPQTARRWFLKTGNRSKKNKRKHTHE